MKGLLSKHVMMAAQSNQCRMARLHQLLIMHCLAYSTLPIQTRKLRALSRTKALPQMRSENKMKGIGETQECY